MSLTDPQIGRLVSIRDGWYFRAADVDDSKGTGNIHYRIRAREGDKALLLEHQGKTEDRICWTAFVNGEVLIVWEDDIHEKDAT